MWLGTLVGKRGSYGGSVLTFVFGVLALWAYPLSLDFDLRVEFHEYTRLVVLVFVQ
jgi:hypothetical protein